MITVDLKELERVHKGLANRRRIAILKHLKAHPGSSVGQLAEAIALSFKSTSKHMAVLAAAGLVDREQVSLAMLYRIARQVPQTATALVEVL
jgi:DNA-binding transcriptional ArsR family regulator